MAVVGPVQREPRPGTVDLGRVQDPRLPGSAEGAEIPRYVVSVGRTEPKEDPRDGRIRPRDLDLDGAGSRRDDEPLPVAWRRRSELDVPQAGGHVAGAARVRLHPVLDRLVAVDVADDGLHIVGRVDDDARRPLAPQVVDVAGPGGGVGRGVRTPVRRDLRLRRSVLPGRPRPGAQAAGKRRGREDGKGDPSERGAGLHVVSGNVREYLSGLPRGATSPRRDIVGRLVRSGVAPSRVTAPICLADRHNICGCSIEPGVSILAARPGMADAPVRDTVGRATRPTEWPMKRSGAPVRGPRDLQHDRVVGDLQGRDWSRERSHPTAGSSTPASSNPFALSLHASQAPHGVSPPR